MNYNEMGIKISQVAGAAYCSLTGREDFSLLEKIVKGIGKQG